jgi:hypothetical protein
MAAGAGPACRKEPVMRIRRHAVVLLLAGSLLGVSAAPASTFRGENPSSESRPAMRSAMDLFRHLESLLRSLWSKNGCHIDPWGMCETDPGSSGSSAPLNKEGCAIDPAGGCLAGH